MRRANTNQISKAMILYREDYRSNREWWQNRMGVGQNIEYLAIHYKNGNEVIIDSNYFKHKGATCLPRFRSDEVAYISRYYGDNIETATAADIVVDTDRIILYNNGVEYFRCEMGEDEYKEMRRRKWELDDDADSTAWMLDYCLALAISKMNDNTTANETLADNDLATMNANETISAAITDELDTRNDRSTADRKEMKNEKMYDYFVNSKTNECIKVINGRYGAYGKRAIYDGGSLFNYSEKRLKKEWFERRSLTKSEVSEFSKKRIEYINNVREQHRHERLHRAANCVSICLSSEPLNIGNGNHIYDHITNISGGALEAYTGCGNGIAYIKGGKIIAFHYGQERPYNAPSCDYVQEIDLSCTQILF